MIDQDLAAFVQGPVMMILATRSAAGLPAIGRAIGARVTSGRDAIDIFVSPSQWADVLSGVVAGSQIAFTACRPSDYKTFQIKGEVLDVSPMDPADQAVAERYADDMTRELLGLGLQPHQIDHWLTRVGLVRLRLQPRSTFAQTPGPGAGAQLAQIAP
ncbi:hypothetical protein [Phenylobacterium sp.]|uniref:hypothetical protein n=1 Tax=Phenylobacterium sp. TaxID=1871053 RepID=UPI002FC84D07